MDWGTVLALAAITWLDGVRRLPPDAVILRRVLGGAWTIVDSAERRRPWHVVSWWSPLTLALIVPPDGVAAGEASLVRADDALAGRLARSRCAVIVLRVLGALVLLGIVLGVPAAVARFGAWGFVGALGGAMLLALAASAVAMRAVLELGGGWRVAARTAAPLLWPFNTGRASEVVLGHAAAGAPQLVVARRLLGDARFAAWARPHAYDALHRAGNAGGRGVALRALVGGLGLVAIVDAPPADCGPDESYCPRCARVYRAGTSACAECPSVVLSAPSAGRGFTSSCAGRASA